MVLKESMLPFAQTFNFNCEDCQIVFSLVLKAFDIQNLVKQVVDSNNVRRFDILKFNFFFLTTEFLLLVTFTAWIHSCDIQLFLFIQISVVSDVLLTCMCFLKE